MTASEGGRWTGGLLVEGGFEVSTSRDRLDRAVLLNTLSETYWAGDVAPEQILESIANALPFGLYEGARGRQIGFARVVTDMSRFAWVSDVFVVDGFKGRGCGTLLMRAVLSYPPLASVYTWTLATRDAHAFYEGFGFRLAEGKEATMQLRLSRQCRSA